MVESLAVPPQSAFPEMEVFKGVPSTELSTGVLANRNQTHGESFLCLAVEVNQMAPLRNCCFYHLSVELGLWLQKEEPQSPQP